MMKHKRRVMAASLLMLATVPLLTACGQPIELAARKAAAASHQEKIDTRKFQEKAATTKDIEKAFSDLETQSKKDHKKGQVTVVTFFKKGCKRCSKMQDAILKKHKELQGSSAYDITFLYVDAESGQLNDVMKHLSSNPFGAIKTPYSFVLRSDSATKEDNRTVFVPTFKGRMRDDKAVEALGEHIASTSKLAIDQIKDYTDLGGK